MAPIGRTFRRVTLLVVTAMLGAVVAGSAEATVLTGTMTVDNAFYAYISASPSEAGALIATGDDWTQSFALTPTSLSPGKTYYLNIEAMNYGQAAGFSGVFSLSDSAFQFANGAQTLTTDPSNLSAWTGAYNGDSSVTAQPWVAAAGAVLQSHSYNWGDIAGTASWIWPSDPGSSGDAWHPCQYCTVDFTTTITPLTSAVPEPGAWMMLAAGFGALGATARVRRRALPAV